MKIRFVEHITGFPAIEIMPDSGKFDSLDAVITVNFFDWLEHDKIYKVSIRPNIYFGKISPEDALQWARCLEASYQIANKIMPESIGLEQSREVRMCWIRVNEVFEKIK